jgi:DNA-binding NarL/FixJ family response regulator
VKTLQPDVAVLDIEMPGLTGIDAMQAMGDLAPGTKVLVLSGIDRPEVVNAALAAGCNGYLLKDFVLAELQFALDTVMDGGSYLSPKIQQQLLDAMRSDKEGATDEPPLTPRQEQILRLVASGRTTKEIARDLGISPKTVEFHRAQLMERLGLHDVAGMTATPCSTAWCPESVAPISPIS